MTENELQEWHTKAPRDPSLVYYAARHWGSQPLAEGCCSSPTRIYLEVTQRCNLSCLMCYRNAGRALPREFDKMELMQLLRNLAILGVHELRINVGEPTMRPDILELIDTAISFRRAISD